MTDPNIIAELQRIAEEHQGELRPADIVEAARPLTSILHPHFQWDDTAAAHAYRIQQARQLLRITVEYIGVGAGAHLARVFVSLSPDRNKEGGGYRAMKVVLSEPDYRRQLLADALDELRAFEKKYGELQELGKVFDAIIATVGKREKRKRPKAPVSKALRGRRAVVSA